MKDWDIWAILVGFSLVLVGGSFWLGVYEGRKYEKHQVEIALPPVMDGLCNDCNNIGDKLGYKRGVATCDDVLNSLPDGGHR